MRELSPFSPEQQFQCLNLLTYLSDLFTCAGKDTFSRVEILRILNLVANDSDLFDPEVVIAQQEATAETEVG